MPSRRGEDHRFVGKDDYAALLAAGLIGQTGSVVTELEKARREREAYLVYRRLFAATGNE